MTIHELKCWPEYFEPLVQGKKTAEIRKNDRDFKVGDRLLLREWDPNKHSHGWYTGRYTVRTITHVLDLYSLVSGVEESGQYVMLSLGDAQKEKP
jgi:hypothetical protein